MDTSAHRLEVGEEEVEAFHRQVNWRRLVAHFHLYRLRRSGHFTFIGERIVVRVA